MRKYRRDEPNPLPDQTRSSPDRNDPATWPTAPPPPRAPTRTSKKGRNQDHTTRARATRTAHRSAPTHARRRATIVPSGRGATQPSSSRPSSRWIQSGIPSSTKAGSRADGSAAGSVPGADRSPSTTSHRPNPPIETTRSTMASSASRRYAQFSGNPSPRINGATISRNHQADTTVPSAAMGRHHRSSSRQTPRMRSTMDPRSPKTSWRVLTKSASVRLARRCPLASRAPAGRYDSTNVATNASAAPTSAAVPRARRATSPSVRRGSTAAVALAASGSDPSSTSIATFPTTSPWRPGRVTSGRSSATAVARPETDTSIGGRVGQPNERLPGCGP